MKNKTLTHTIKLPSGDVVNIKNMWELCKVISLTGKSFTEEHLIKNGSPTNKNGLFRVLSYLKYLGIIFDTRKIQENKRVQEWHQQDKSKVSEMFYTLKAGREEEAKAKFIEIILNHELFSTLKETLFKKNTNPTRLDLENYFKSETPGKVPKYYQRGVRFIILLLDFCGVIKNDGKTISLKEDVIKNEELPNQESEKENLGKTQDEISDHCRYMIQITGENDTNFKFAVNSSEDLKDIDAILGIISRRLN